MAEERNESNEGVDSSDRGFASMDEEEQRKIASEGGAASVGNFKNDPDRAAEAGCEGGEASAEDRNEGSNQGSRQGGGNNSGQGSEGGDQGGGGQGGRG